MKVSDGKVFFYYFYDVADEIDLKKVEAILKENVLETGLNVYRRLTPEYITYAVPPLLIKLVAKDFEFKKKKAKIHLYAKLFDFGAIVLIANTEFKESLGELNEFASDLYLQPELEQVVKEYRDRLLKRVTPALTNPAQKPYFKEDYIIYYIKKFEKKATAAELAKAHEKEIANLLRFESGNLSEEEIKGVWQNKTSYYANELVLVDFNAAFVYDETEPEPLDLFNVLEYAKLQLLELRYYDSVLDKAIAKTHDDLGKLNKLVVFFKTAKIMQDLSEIKLNVSEIIEKIDNALKLIGDMYLVKVYSIAGHEFHLVEWEENVKKKLALIAEIYGKLEARVNNMRFTLLEGLLVCLELIFIYLWIGEILHWF
ncbi:hypothetical protein HZB89_01475, partial [archaeon]|nr:hypothetical protein [archaeon]